jgi:DNA-binding GntR family transcriptional regulator
MAASEQKAYEAIRNAITAGDFGTGKHLRARELADLLGISRTPVREALRRLHAEGLVEFFENRGAFVTGWSTQDAEEVFDLRAVLESHAAAVAAEKLGAAHIEKLAAWTDTMEAHASGSERDIAVVTYANRDFHNLIVAATASRRLSAVIASVVEMALVSRTFSFYSPTDFARSIAHHRELIEAFKARDRVWAAAVMNSHIRAAYHVFTASLVETADPAAPEDSLQ